MSSRKTDPFGELNFVKNRVRVVVRLSPEVRYKLSEEWKKRDFPDPSNPNKSIVFKSEQDFLEFIVRATLKQGSNGWYWFKNMFNPDYPQE
jgi:hypothetical protein